MSGIYYDAFFSQRGLVLVELSAEVIEQATELRARYRFKAPDAIYLATALVEQADVFLTGDADIARCAEIRVEVLEP